MHENLFEGISKEEVSEEYSKQQSCITVDFSNPVSMENIFKHTSYILFQNIMITYIPEYKEKYEINKVIFQRSEWNTDTSLIFYFKTEDGNIKTVSSNDFEKGYVYVYHYTEDYACK
jgi:hypothetical protein